MCTERRLRLPGRARGARIGTSADCRRPRSSCCRPTGRPGGKHDTRSDGGHVGVTSRKANGVQKITLIPCDRCRSCRAPAHIGSCRFPDCRTRTQRRKRRGHIPTRSRPKGACSSWSTKKGGSMGTSSPGGIVHDRIVHAANRSRLLRDALQTGFAVQSSACAYSA